MELWFQVRNILKHYCNRGTIARKPGSGYSAKLSTQILAVINMTMRDETTATQLQSKLASFEVYISLSTIL